MSRVRLEIFPLVKKAIRCYFEALHLDESFIESRFHAALNLQKIYNFQESLKQLTMMIEVKPDDKIIWIQRGLVY
jgi:tetratricopeptide (TPR) repeat protein